MEINKVIEDKCATVALSGRLDTLTSPQLEEALRELPADITKLVIDLKDLEYVSSAGLRVFLNAQKSMMEKGEMTSDIAFVGKVVEDICYNNAIKYLGM